MAGHDCGETAMTTTSVTAAAAGGLPLVARRAFGGATAFPRGTRGIYSSPGAVHKAGRTSGHAPRASVRNHCTEDEPLPLPQPLPEEAPSSPPRRILLAALALLAPDPCLMALSGAEASCMVLPEGQTLSLSRPKRGQWGREGCQGPLGKDFSSPRPALRGGWPRDYDTHGPRARPVPLRPLGEWARLLTLLQVGEGGGEGERDRRGRDVKGQGGGGGGGKRGR